MSSLYLSFQKQGLNVFMELNKFSFHKIQEIRDNIVADNNSWEVCSVEHGSKVHRDDLNIIVREGDKIVIVCGKCDVTTGFTPGVKAMILDECYKIVGDV